MKNQVVIKISSLLFIGLWFIIGCEKDNGAEETDTSGYNCVSNNCQFVKSGAGYSSLSDCESTCAENEGGNNAGGNESEDNAYAVSWQNNAGFWFAVGPIQQTSAGSTTEEEALGYVIPSSDENIEYVDICNDKYKVYTLNRDYESWDLNTMKFMREHNNYPCNWPE